MKKYILIIILVVAAAVIVFITFYPESAANKSEQVGFHRVYSGTLPCADCMGIVETLTINSLDNKTGHYWLTDKYLTDRVTTNTFYSKGTWQTVILEGNTIYKLTNEDLSQTSPYYYKLRSDLKKVTMVDESGKEPEATNLNFSLDLQ